MKLPRSIALLPFLLFSLSQVQAFTLTNLHSFAVSPVGAQPTCTLVTSAGGLLYGTTQSGGTNGGGGTVFSISTNGALTSLHSLNGAGDGNNVMASLATGAGGVFYGASVSGGQNGLGTIFKVGADGTFTVLYNFGASTNISGVALDGSQPEGTLVLGRDGRLYGTTFSGGAFDQGTVFRITTNGTLITTLYTFGTVNDGSGDALDGANPVAGLIQGADGSFYGTTSYGGVNDVSSGGDGTVFQILTNGTLNVLHSFDFSDGATPDAGLIQAPDGSLYGTTASGGSGSSGTAFQITTNGAFTSLYPFSGGTDGSDPEGRLLLASDGNLYGTTAGGGDVNGDGTLFQLTTAGSLTTLVQFNVTNGATPMAGLVQTANGIMYGTTDYGGTNGIGVVFRVTTGGSEAVLFSFPETDDGANPSADLLLAKDGNFYGTTEAGGDFGFGTVFRMSPAGNLTLLYTFGSMADVSGNPLDGESAEGALIQGQDGGLYGTTPGGGASGDGTIYRITTNGVFNLLYAFSSSDGSGPWGGLVQTPDGAMYGTTTAGGSGNGTLFRITTNGTLTTLYSFTGSSDGSTPYAGLIRGPGGLLYGTTAGDGTSTFGSVFACDTNGNLTTLYPFTGGTDGSDPEASLLVGKDGALYGTTAAGGDANGDGTVFRVTTNGVLTTLVQFDGANGSAPLGDVFQTADGNIYGTTSAGGTGGNGVVFQIATNGTLTGLSLDGLTGSYLDSGVAPGPDGNLYTLAEYGGFGGSGSIFRVNIVTPAPVFQKIAKSANKIVLTWSAVSNSTYQLQFKTNLTQASWINLGAALVATNGTLQTSDTPGADPRRFYRVGLVH